MREEKCATLYVCMWVAALLVVCIEDKDARRREGGDGCVRVCVCVID